MKIPHISKEETLHKRNSKKLRSLPLTIQVVLLNCPTMTVLLGRACLMNDIAEAGGGRHLAPKHLGAEETLEEGMISAPFRKAL